jgi:serine acetyltransferase
MWPVYWWCRQVGGRHEIPPRAEIGCGLRVIHCSLACVLSPLLIAGKNLYLTGGNVIGRRRARLNAGAIRLGDDVMLGIHSLVIGPLEIGDRVRIGAGAVVVKSLPHDSTIVSAPARNLTAEAEARDC